jgi:hypothetical protein
LTWWLTISIVLSIEDTLALVIIITQAAAGSVLPRE